MHNLKNLLTNILKNNSAGLDLVTWAESPSGLGFTLFPRQRLILNLIDASPLPYPDDPSAIPGLLSHDNPYASIWLPPNWRYDPATGVLQTPGRPLIVLLLAGRRSGKTSIASIVLARRLLELSRRKRFPGVKLLKGQTIGAVNVAADERQARILFERTVENLRIVGACDDKTPSNGSIRIGKRVLYESLTTSAGAVRGRTAAVCALDELAHFPGTLGPASASNIFDALLPSVRSFGTLGQIIITTSPAGMQGKVWELYEQRGIRDDLLVLQFATWEIHPFITREMLTPDFEIDPLMASCEYGAQFATVDSPFLDADSIRQCVREASHPVPAPGIHRRMHLDPAFARDRFAIVIACRDGSTVFIDEAIAINPIPGKPLTPDMTKARIAQLAGKYNISEVSFDQYCAPYIERELRTLGLRAKKIDFTASSKMAIYSNLRVLISSGQISIPDDPDLLLELTHLRRIIRPAGFSVSAPSSGAVTTDDLADALAAVSFLLTEENDYDGSMVYIPGGF